MKLHTLKPATGSVRTNTRIGRGQGSGKGGTSTKGHKGAQARTGYNEKFGFEGGQMPLQRRLPKFGFTSPFRKEYKVLNLNFIQYLTEKHAGLTNIDHDTLVKLGIISANQKLVKILGEGELKAKVTITANKFSASAKQAIEAAGGQAITLE